MASAAGAPIWRRCRRKREALYDRLPTKYFQCALSRFLHFISAQGIRPDQVTDAVAQQFLAALERHSSIKDPRETHKNICRVWNKARAQVPGWPDVMLIGTLLPQDLWPALERISRRRSRLRSTPSSPIRSTTAISSPTPAAEAAGAAHDRDPEGPSALRRLGPGAHGPRSERDRRSGLPRSARACAPGAAVLHRPQRRQAERLRRRDRLHPAHRGEVRRRSAGRRPQGGRDGTTRRWRSSATA